MNRSLKTMVWRTAVTSAIIILIAACLYTEENARGLHAWRKAEREIAARGGSLNWDSFVPAPVPAAENFFQAPMMAEWFERSTNSGAPLSSGPSLASVMANPDNSASFIDQLSASNYVSWSAGIEPQLAEIREALKRPSARMDGSYATLAQQPMPNFVSYRIVGQVLSHRAKCYLLLGQPEKALEDLTLLNALNGTLVGHGRFGLLVATMVHVAIAGMYADALAYGLNGHLWRDPELVQFERQLGAVELLPMVAGSLQAERAGLCRSLDAFSLDHFFRGSSPGAPTGLAWWLIPRGWIDQNKALVVTLEDQLIQAVDLTNRTVSPFRAAAAWSTADRTLRRPSPYNFIAMMCVPNFSKALEVAARTQTWTDQARIVCALERYQQANRAYPTALSVLVPNYVSKLPNDVVSGKPMIYRLKDEQTFLLYSVGWNEADDGGITVETKDGKEDRESGDWVWHYPVQ